MFGVNRRDFPVSSDLGQCSPGITRFIAREIYAEVYPSLFRLIENNASYISFLQTRSDGSYRC